MIRFEAAIGCREAMHTRSSKRGFIMKKFLAATALVIGCWAGSAEAATTISFNGGSGTLSANTYVFENYDALASGTAIGSNAFAYSGTNGAAARPAFGTTGNFGAVLSGGSYTVNFGPTSIFSFVLGSLDTFNALTLRYMDGTSTTFTGGAIVGDASLDNSGNRTIAETNGVVTYTVTSGSLLTGATFASSDNSFEFDNLSAAVPEPAAWGMMILGFGLIGGAMRRRSATKTTVTFA